MITEKTYNTLVEEYGNTSSFTLWSNPENGKYNSNSNIGDLSIFKSEDILNKLKNDFLLICLNPANHKPVSKDVKKLSSFHSDYSFSKDFKLRAALKNTPLYGCFITDLIPSIIETDSSKVLKTVDEKYYRSSIQEIIRIRNILGDKATIVAVGDAAYRILKKYLPKNVELIKIRHYSSYCGANEYREIVHKQLQEQL